MKKKKEKPDSNMVNEPQPVYDNRVIITTFAELEERDLEHARSLTHLERLAYLQKLISIVHGHDFTEQEEAFYKGKITVRKLE